MVQTRTRTRAPRWRQCSLRSLLGITTLVCVGLAAYTGRQRYLEHSVVSFNALMDEHRFSEAEALARHVHAWYGTTLTEAMLEKAAFASAWARNPPPDSGPSWHFGCSDIVDSYESDNRVPMEENRSESRADPWELTFESPHAPD